MDAVTRSIITAVAVVALGQAGWSGRVAAQTPAPQTRMVPMFEPDPSWPKLPSKWVFGQVSSVSIDEQGHAWVLQRPSTVRADQKAKAWPRRRCWNSTRPAISSRAGAGRAPAMTGPKPSTASMSTPRASSGSAATAMTDNHLVKFTKDGKFVMQIGQARARARATPTRENVKQAGRHLRLYAKTNELFVADGYGNRRIIVFDADTGKFKRMWGAFGNKPLDDVPARRRCRRTSASPPRR